MKVNYYITRHLKKIDDVHLGKTLSLPYETTTLDKLIQNSSSPDGSKRIVILGEAGSGKSIELFNHASRLYNNRDRNTVPVFIPLNTYTGDNFKEYAIAKLGPDANMLLNYDKTKLIFFLDEFDQVLNKEAATRQIQTFIDLYREALFVISCRTNFYTNQFSSFDIYFLSSFDEEDITEFSKAELPNTYKQFINKINSVRIKEIAKIPFFLKYLIDLFKKNGDIPNSQTDLLEMVIINALNNDISKLSEFDLRNKYTLDNIKKDLTLISLTLEMLQRNYLDASEIDYIVKNDFKSGVIKRLSLINKSYVNGKEAFQFLHNNFNEYLAAKCLSSRPFDEVIDFLSVKAPLIKLPVKGRVSKLIKYFNLEIYGLKISDLITDIAGIKKNIGINPSWVNTLGFLTQLRSNRDIIDYLVNHEPKIALNIELSRLTEDDKYLIFESILNDYRDKKIIIREDLFFKLSEIVFTSDKHKRSIYNYLTKYAIKGEHQNERYNCLHLLPYLKRDYCSDIVNTLISRINDPSEIEANKHICMISLVELGATGRDIVDQIIAVSETDNDYILSGLYYLLSNSPDIDKYIDQLIAGIPKSRIDYKSDESRLGDERYYLAECLKKIISPPALKAIIDFLEREHAVFHDYDIKELIAAVVKNLTRAYAADITIFDYAKKLLLSAEKAHSDELSEIGNFFINTKTTLKIFKDLLSSGFDKHYYALAAIVSDETKDLLIEEYKQGHVSEDNIWIYVRHVSIRNQSKYTDILDFINSKTNNKFVPEAAIDYKALDEQRLLRKVEIIFSKTEFIKELENIFDRSNKSMITYQETIDLEHENWRDNRTKYNSFVIDEIQKILLEDRTKKWSLKDLIEKINTYNYSVFTFEHIFKLLYEGARIKLNEQQIKFIKDYCKAYLNKVNFRTALTVTRKEDGTITTSANGLALKIWFYKRKINLELPESVMLDMLSFDWIEQSAYCGIDYLLDELEGAKVTERIKQNLLARINIASVLINHVRYCLENNVTGVLEDIYFCMNSEFIDNHDKKKIMDLLVKFDGGKKFIKKYLESDNKELYLKAADLLGDSEDIREIIHERLNDSNEDIAMESAKWLIPRQDIRALEFYVNHIIKRGSLKQEMHSPVAKIDNFNALDCLVKLLLFYCERQEELQNTYSFILMDIMQALKNIARKDYRNLRKVDRVLEKFIKKHEKKWSFVVHLNRYRDEIEHEYYASYKEVSTLNDGVQKARTIWSNC